MKQSPSEKELMRSLRPSRFSASGFLGSDSRPVDEIINDDLTVLGKLRVSIDQLVEALTHAYEKAQKAFGGEILVRTGVTARFHESMGRVPSPFQGEGVFEKGEVVVKDMDTGQKIIITPLGIHLVDKHGFFQGTGSPYRIDPEKAVAIFRLTAEQPAVMEKTDAFHTSR